MSIKKFNSIDRLIGLLVFITSAIVYCMTIEPTASFWDCPEFISSSYKLEIGHPPGAPFFMLTANFFSLFTSDPSQVARMVNTMSALLSAGTILFLFWTITHLTRKLILKDWSRLDLTKLIAIQGSGIVGALIYTFSDTFWFSAVEGEVYAYSSFITALVFWLILKWEDHADEPHSDKWLVLICYLTGLSIGVHLLNLLCIPAIVLVYSYRKFPKIETKGSIIALLIAFFGIAAVLYGLIPGVITVGGWFELFFVNVLGCPFNTGMIIYIFILGISTIWALYCTYKGTQNKTENLSCILTIALLGIPFYGYGIKAVIIGFIVLGILYFILSKKQIDKVTKTQVPLISSRIKNTVLLCLTMIIVGYSSYALIIIRSSANPPMDQNSPEDIFTLGGYLSRDQYGDRPLLYGNAYGSEVALEIDGNRCKPKRVEGEPIWQRKEKADKNEKDTYVVVDHKYKYIYAQNMLFPRMYSEIHTRAYEEWMGGIEGYTVPFDKCGEMVQVKMPTMIENLKFFLSYQCNFMYWRYFMWNFAGRQNDLLSGGEMEHGNWLSGFSWFDDMRLGDQSKLPDILKENKGHNVYYCLPLLLGLIGLFWQAFRGQRGIRQFWVVFFLFFMTGLAIVIYLNQTPQQPRERDYSFAGSFYAFAIWCGLGVAAIIDLAKKYLKTQKPAIAAVISLLCLFVPIQMASQNWDDHDRSDRYTCRDYGQNYLNSLQDKGNPIIFTNGDNDTFPLWYNQDVEGVRTDSRVCNLSYLQTDWYIDQMRRPAYDSPALPITWPRIEYWIGTNEYVAVNAGDKNELLSFYKEHPKEAEAQFGKEPFELKNILKNWVRNKDLNYIPTDSVYINVDKQKVKESGMLIANDSIPQRMYISLKGRRMLTKKDLLMLEIIANTNWTRPVYIAETVGQDNYMNLGDNFIQEGLANRITPFNTTGAKDINFDTEKTYQMVMHKFKYGGVKTKGIYLDETVMRMCYTHRRLMAMLANKLAAKGEIQKAKDILKKTEEEIPYQNVPLEFISGVEDMIQAYLITGQKQKALQTIKECWKISEQFADWYLNLDADRLLSNMNSFKLHMYILSRLNALTENADSAIAKAQKNAIERKAAYFYNKAKISPEAQD